MAQEVDVVVVGMGPGGEYLAGQLAAAGLNVIGVEAELLGGECPYWGCVPSKMMIRAGNLLAEGRRIPGMAGRSQVEADFGPVAARIRDEATDDWNDRAAVERYEGQGGHFVRGRGELTGPRTVRVGEQEFTARLGVALATGTVPQIPPIPGLAETPYWTNRDAVSAKEAPGSLLVLGGGAIGVELAQVYSRFGTRVTVVEAADRLLALEEPEAGALLAEVLGREGLTVRTSARAAQVRHDGEEFTVTLDGGEELTAQQLLVATGRKVDLSKLGVDTVGLDPHARSLAVDGRMRAADGLWGVGDVTGRGAFTHMAMYQAEIALRDILGRGGPDADYRALPRVTFTDPEIGAVGLTEAQAREQGLRVRTGFTEVSASTRGWIHKPGNEGFFKLVEDADRGVLVGATSVGPAGGEVLYGLAVAIQAAVPTEQLEHMIYAYPTFHRAVQVALTDLS
ncbi:MAG TPA: NAD(P)/FAD-dependent oxidoreductase [Actinocrinis sp.]|nr:NAD(P)/FAD-dependent oxidoreductase [Actinocrinis sp.]